MRYFALAIAAVAALLTSCGGETRSSAPEPVKKAQAPRPADESARFPQANVIETRVVDEHLLGKAFMPGGTVARCKKGKAEYEMFVAKLPSATDAAILLPDWRNALTDAKFVAAYGGYYGADNGRPVFVFTKDVWIAGVAGLPEKDAEPEARLLAAKLR